MHGDELKIDELKKWQKELNDEKAQLDKELEAKKEEIERKKIRANISHTVGMRIGDDELRESARDAIAKATVEIKELEDKTQLRLTDIESFLREIEANIT